MAKKSYSKSKIMRDHELQIAMVNAFAKDPELKYFVGMAAGAGVAWVGAMLGQATVQTGPGWNPWTKRYEEGYVPSPGSTTPEEFAKQQEEKNHPYSWLWTPGGKYSGQWFATQATGMDFSGGIASNVGNIIMLGGTGFAGTCAMILILKSIFSGTDLGDLLPDSII